MKSPLHIPWILEHSNLSENLRIPLLAVQHLHENKDNYLCCTFLWENTDKLASENERVEKIKEDIQTIE